MYSVLLSLVLIIPKSVLDLCIFTPWDLNIDIIAKQNICPRYVLNVPQIDNVRTSDTDKSAVFGEYRKQLRDGQSYFELCASE